MMESLTKTPRPLRDFSVDWDIDYSKCMYCEDKPCLKVCPIDAVYVDNKDKNIKLADTCFGCVLCSEACPYDAIKINKKLADPIRENVPNINTKLCRACGACVQACKTGAIHLVTEGDGEFHSKIDPDKCIGCGYCFRSCPADAIKYGEILPKAIEGGNAIAIDQDTCIGCMTCLRICPSKGSITVGTNNLPYINPSYCARCEECMNVCPSNSIDYVIREDAFKTYNKLRTLDLCKTILDRDSVGLSADVIAVDTVLEDMSMKFEDLKGNAVETAEDSEILRVDVTDTFKMNLNSYIDDEIKVEKVYDLVQFYPPDREITVTKDNCIGCGLCLEVCPVNAIENNLPEPIDIGENCVYCGQCVEACNFDAIHLIESYYDGEEYNLYFCRRNVEGLRDGKFTIESDNCQSCGVCVKQCPVNALELVNDKIICTQEKCISCRECESLCPVNAIKIQINK